jgi:hypothetical protein
VTLLLLLLLLHVALWLGCPWHAQGALEGVVTMHGSAEQLWLVSQG